MNWLPYITAVICAISAIPVYIQERIIRRERRRADAEFGMRRHAESAQAAANRALKDTMHQLTLYRRDLTELRQAKIKHDDEWSELLAAEQNDRITTRNALIASIDLLRFFAEENKRLGKELAKKK